MTEEAMKMTDQEALTWMASLIEQGKLGDVLSVTRDAFPISQDLCQDAARILMLEGTAYGLQGDFYSAIEKLYAAKELATVAEDKDMQQRCIYGIALAANKTNSYHLTIDITKDFPEDVDISIMVLLRRAEAFLLLKHYGKVIDMLTPLVDSTFGKKESLDYAVILGTAYVGVNDYEQANKFASRLLDMFPNEKRVLDYVSYIQQGMKKHNARKDNHP